MTHVSKITRPNFPSEYWSRSDSISISQLIGDSSIPESIRTLNSQPENLKLRLYRLLIPIHVLADFDLNPRTWKNLDKLPQVKLESPKESGLVKLSAIRLPSNFV
jgi:hypothetical protein